MELFPVVIFGVAESQLEPSRTSTMELFAEIVNG